jgi:hypothetical protein
VDVDLDLFFDRVQLDALLLQVARKVSDRKILTLIGGVWRRGDDGGGSGRRHRRDRAGLPAVTDLVEHHAG